MSKYMILLQEHEMPSVSAEVALRHLARSQKKSLKRSEGHLFLLLMAIPTSVWLCATHDGLFLCLSHLVQQAVK